jgi:hypothetical protein
VLSDLERELHLDFVVTSSTFPRRREAERLLTFNKDSFSIPLSKIDAWLSSRKEVSTGARKPLTLMFSDTTFIADFVLAVGEILIDKDRSND